ncbi:Transcriptional regulator, AcrR family [Cupriavidus sp. U2]|uniref:CerR family C-terminal domain-containing protein n=1 Tax=Cupriavidus sp. U2 TaxID=2920269 RepID=UPI00129E03BA|nr:CerR family C-terminal domain-containing protein [Cupriavidus sp. U2]KAI3593649.1 Transcriptional regulator, AcrR family [Cupriavidus sp. U2]
MARHRPAAEGGYQRGEETRARIIEAAMRLFAAHGFDGASTRDIAREANVNAPALQYYFDNKEGVYLACIEYFVERAWAMLQDVVAAAEGLLARPDAADADLIDAYLALQSRFANFLYECPETDHWRQFMARERAGMGPPTAFERIDAGINRRIFALTSALIGRLTGQPATDETTRIRTVAIDSQIAAFKIMRRHVLRALEWDGFGEPETRQVHDVLQEHTRILLLGLVALRDQTLSKN